MSIDRVRVQLFLTILITCCPTSNAFAESYVQSSAKRINFSNGTYVGDVLEGAPHGQGEYTFNNRVKISGVFQYGEALEGEVFWPDGNHYKGYIKHNQPHGQGRLTEPGGFYEEGIFSQGSLTREGFTIMHFPGEFTISGICKGGHFNGPGKIEYLADGYKRVLEGSLVEGRLEGQGTETWASGYTYKGEFSDSDYHGYGVLTSEGYQYSGNWVTGEREGQGEEVIAGIGRYFGSWLNNMRHGLGRSTYEDGSFYEGSFFENRFHGRGKFSYEGNTYESQFFGGELHGYTKLTFSDGEVWEMGHSHGELVRYISIAGLNVEEMRIELAQGKLEERQPTRSEKLRELARRLSGLGRTSQGGSPISISNNPLTRTENAIGARLCHYRDGSVTRIGGGKMCPRYN